MYTCPKHGVDLSFDVFKPLEHRCSKDSSELYRGGKYDMAWAGIYNRLLANYLVWMGLLYHSTGDVKYAAAGKEILMQFADLYLKYPTENTILGPAHVFFGTLSESFWGVDMAYGYDLLYNYQGFTPADRQALKINCSILLRASLNFFRKAPLIDNFGTITFLPRSAFFTAIRR
jgi:hypothetical protein